MITIKIDCTKILKEHMFAGKNGAKYLDILLIETPDGKYGNDYMAVQSVSKESRDAGIKGPILGNAKNMGQRSAPRPKPAPSQESGLDDSNPPF